MLQSLNQIHNSENIIDFQVPPLNYPNVPRIPDKAHESVSRNRERHSLQSISCSSRTSPPITFRFIRRCS